MGVWTDENKTIIGLKFNCLIASLSVKLLMKIRL